MNLPGYLSAAVAAGLAAHATSDLRWARTTLALAAGWSALLAWIVWVARRGSLAAAFGLAWFLALLAPLLLLERQFYFFYLYCALPGLLASLALRLHSTGRIASKVAPVLVALVLAQAVAVEVRARSRLRYAPLPSDFVLRRALAARNALTDLEAHAGALKPRLVLVGQQPLETSAGGTTTTRETAYTLDPFWDDNVRAALGEGDAIRLRCPSVEQVKFFRWVDPADSASAIAPYQIDGHLQVMDYATYAGGQNLGPGAGLEERMARAAYLIERRLFPEARSELEAAYRLAPNHPDVMLNLGTVNFRLGDTTAAIRALARTIELAPHDAEALFDLGLVYWLTGRTDAARELWGRLEDEAPRSDLARRARDIMSGGAR